MDGREAPSPQATPSPRPRTVSVAPRKCLDAAFAQALALGHTYVGSISCSVSSVSAIIRPRGPSRTPE